MTESSPEQKAASRRKLSDYQKGIFREAFRGSNPGEFWALSRELFHHHRGAEVKGICRLALQFLKDRRQAVDELVEEEPELFLD